MKQLFFILIFNFSLAFVLCQELEKGLDNNPILNKAESEYFNSFFANQSLEFDFTQKRVAFVSLDFGINPRSKSDYFRYYSAKKTNDIRLVVIDSIECQKTNGYDVLVLMDIPQKKMDKIDIDKIIEKLSVCDKAKPSNLYQLGLDDNPVLTNLESEYFNEVFKANKNNYIFTNLKVGFFKGNNGSMIQSKKQYFDSVKNRLENCISASNDYVLKLDEKEKIESGGYDLIIVSWSKIVPTEKERMIKQLRTKDTF